MRNLLIQQYIHHYGASNDYQKNILKQIITQRCIPKYPEHENVVNKAQRYMAIGALVRAGPEDQEIPADVQAMIDAERKVDFSAVDDLELIKLEAQKPGRVNKQKIWDKYVHDTNNYKQQDFIASSRSFYNHSKRDECMYFADLWLNALETIENTKHPDYFKFFVWNLSPAFLGEVPHRNKMQELLDKHASNTDKSFMCRCLKEEIYEIDKVIALKQHK